MYNLIHFASLAVVLGLFAVAAIGCGVRVARDLIALVK